MAGASRGLEASGGGADGGDADGGDEVGGEAAGGKAAGKEVEDDMMDASGEISFARSPGAKVSGKKSWCER